MVEELEKTIDQPFFIFNSQLSIKMHSFGSAFTKAWMLGCLKVCPFSHWVKFTFTVRQGFSQIHSLYRGGRLVKGISSWISCWRFWVKVRQSFWVSLPVPAWPMYQSSPFG